MYRIAQITDSLYLSSHHQVRDAKLKPLGITLVVNATLEISPLTSKSIRVEWITVPDLPATPLHRHFDNVSDVIHKEISKGGRCLVHCVMGISRSSTLVMAYLMKHCDMSLKEAHHLVKTQRYVSYVDLKLAVCCV